MRIVCVPAYNEGKSITRVLTNILNQVDNTTRVIVVSDNSNDNTVARVQYLQDAHSNLYLIKNDKRYGKARAMNTVISMYPNAIILVHDGDLIALPGAIQRLFEAFKDHSMGIVSGRAVPVGNRTNTVQYWGYLMYEYTNHKLVIENISGQVLSIIGGFYAFRANAVKSVPERMVADDKFTAYKVYQSKYRSGYDSNAGVLITTPKTLRDLFIQLRRWTCGIHEFKSISSVDAPTLGKLYGISYLLNIIRAARFNPVVIFKVLTLGLFYTITDLVAWIAFRRGTLNHLWRQVASTKQL